MTTGELRDCVVLVGPELRPWRCRRFAWAYDTITVIDRREPVATLEDGALVVIPGLYNAHTHIGDSCWPDGATGMTLEEGFFRPDGFKYRELARISPEEQLRHMVGHLRYMARTGTVGHFDFREQGAHGAELLRRAAALTGVDSVILSQFDRAPFSQRELETNTAPLPAESRRELASLMALSDGFSESTMNDLTDTAWREVRHATDAAGKLRAVHCLENPGYRSVSLERTGRGDLARAFDLFVPHLVVHLTVANDDEVQLMRSSGSTAVLNPRANASLGLPAPPLKSLLESGVRLMLGTDNGLLNSPNLWPELDMAYRIAKSQFGDAVRPQPVDILRMVTSNIPASLGPERRGYLDRRLPATFVVLDFTQPHLRATRNLHASIVSRVGADDVLATYREGRELYCSDRYNSCGSTERWQAEPPVPAL